MKLKYPDLFYVFLAGISFCLLLFGLGEKLSFLTYSFGRIFAWTPGDIFDGALNNWFLENNLQYFLKGGNIFNISKMFDTNLYWPEKNTLAMSDNWILITPIYAFLRTVFSPNFSFTGIIVLSLTANFMACYRLCRHGTNNKIYRLLASFLSAFSLTVLARLGHAQLMPAFAGVLAMDSFIEAVNLDKEEIKSSSKQKTKKFNHRISISLSDTLVGVIWLFIQIGIGFYQGTFFTIASLCLLFLVLKKGYFSKNSTLVFSRIRLKNKLSKISLLLKLSILSFISIIDFSIYKQYLIYSSSQQGRSWGEVSSMIPKLWSIWFNTLSTPSSVSLPAPVQTINSNSYPGPFWEHSMFPGYTFMLLLFIGIIFVFKDSPINKQNNIFKFKVITLSQVCLLMFFLTLGFGGTNPVITPWLFIWKIVPGMSALRAVSRIGIPIVLILAPFLAWTLSELHNRLDKKLMTVVLSILFMIYLAGNVTKGISRFDSTDYAAKKVIFSNKIEKIIKKRNCKVFYMTSPDTKNWMYDRVYPQMMAMWASLKTGIPTSSGYSGNNPNMGWNHMMTNIQLEEWLRKKGINEEEIKTVCWIDGNEILN